MDYFKPKLYFFEGLSNDECMFISNIFSWSKQKKFKEPVYKKDSEMAAEIHCTVRAIRYMRKRLIDLGFIKISSRENLKFNGSTPYVLEVKKISEKGNPEIINEINKLTGDGVTKMITPCDNFGNRECQKRQQPITKIVTSYIEQTTPSIHSDINPPPPLEGGVSSSRLSNDFLNSKFQEFLEIANLPDYPLSKQQEARTLFLGQLQSDLGAHTIDDFLGCARAYYVENRPTDPKYIIQPHNFISKKQAGTNHRINPWKDWIGRAKPKAGELPEHLRPVNDLDKCFQELAKKTFPNDFLSKLGCHLLGFSKNGEPEWNNQVFVNYEFRFQEEKLNTIINQLKEEFS